MALSEFKQGTVICGAGEALTHLPLIAKGSAEASVNGHSFLFEKGDIMGLYDLSSGIHSRTYTAVSDVTIISYPYDDVNTLETLLRGNADAANLLVNSMCHQISDFLQYRSELTQEADHVYEAAHEIYPQYENLCAQYALTPKKLPSLSAVTRFSGADPVEDWMHNYYMEIMGLDPAVRKGFFYKNPGISSGFLHRGVEDIPKVLEACRVYQAYITEIAEIFLNRDGHDLFAIITELHYDSIHIKGADAAVETLMVQLTGLLYSMTGIDPAYYQKRLGSYKDTLVMRRASKEMTDAPSDTRIKQNLSDSLDVILNYAACTEELRNRFTDFLQKYTELEDRGGSDDATRRLRKDLTGIFYTIYQDALIKSLNDPAAPTIIKMFLNFGYVDATLAGHENADFLYSIADSLKGDPELGVYTVREWLTAIYKGEKEPCRNEFDTDYNEYIRELKVTGKIDEKEEARRLKDLEGKLRFELENVFPIANKITFGRITTFCPLFADHNMQRKPEASLLTPASLRQALDEIRGIDYSAYCRDILYSNPKSDVSNETIHVEVLPDFILMPNVGIRGTMWQEIEGRKRATPARVFLPLFLEADIKTLLIRLTGEFRWEMCKRIQGMRWNDITNPSLTSEYCDYLQFYKNNKELSVEVRDGIKIELTRAKNNYKNVFIANYAEWLLYESNGSPRLNRIALKMMLTYAPFAPEIREKLMQNPRYTEMLNRYNTKRQQNVQRLNNLFSKIRRGGKQVPQELLDELEYANK